MAKKQSPLSDDFNKLGASENDWRAFDFEEKDKDRQKPQHSGNQTPEERRNLPQHKMTVAELKQAPSSEKVPFESILVVQKITLKRAKNGTEFAAVELGDKTGVFHTICFENSAAFLFFKQINEGAVIKTRGNTDYYQNRFQPRITNIEEIPPDVIAGSDILDSLVESASEAPEVLQHELKERVASIEHEGLRRTVEIALEEIGEVFYTVPAAVSMHHAYRFGLLEHTVRATRAAAAVLPLYPSVNPDLTLAGVILHDIGKALEYLEGLATRKTRIGIMQGHVVLGYRQVRRAAMLAKLSPDLCERLEHIILSHQGELEWGAAVHAATPEAVLVSKIDDLDAKMGMVEYALRTTPPDAEFSEFMPGLQAPLLTAPVNLEGESKGSGQEHPEPDPDAITGEYDNQTQDPGDNA